MVDYNGLENRRAERHRGFESLSLRFRYSEMNIREKFKKIVSIIATSSYDTFLLYLYVVKQKCTKNGEQNQFTIVFPKAKKTH